VGKIYIYIFFWGGGGANFCQCAYVVSGLGGLGFVLSYYLCFQEQCFILNLNLFRSSAGPVSENEVTITLVM
jgi:hypothetical protein